VGSSRLSGNTFSPSSSHFQVYVSAFSCPDLIVNGSASLYSAPSLKEDVMPRPIRLLLVDDHEEFLTALTRLIAAESSLTVVGSARSGKAAVEQVRLTQPDVVVMDLRMPEMDGMEATRQLKAHPAAPFVVILTLHEILEYRMAAMAAGADGFLSKIGCEDTLVSLLKHLCLTSPRGQEGSIRDEITSRDLRQRLRRRAPLGDGSAW